MNAEQIRALSEYMEKTANVGRFLRSMPLAGNQGHKLRQALSGLESGASQASEQAIRRATLEGAKSQGLRGASLGALAGGGLGAGAGAITDDNMAAGALKGGLKGALLGGGLGGGAGMLSGGIRADIAAREAAEAASNLRGERVLNAISSSLNPKNSKNFRENLGNMLEKAEQQGTPSQTLSELGARLSGEARGNWLYGPKNVSEKKMDDLIKQLSNIYGV